MRTAHQPYALNGAGFWLRLSVHFDAFRSDPGAYLIAFWWRLRGKRLRSRSQFARLLGGSRRAYDLWMLWHEEAASSGDASDAPVPIVALVDAQGAGEGALAESLASLSAAGLLSLVIRTSDMPASAEVVNRIDWLSKPWLLPMTAGDRVAPDMERAYRAAIAGIGADAGGRIIYADDDLLGPSGRRTAPHFKPNWNSELFRYHDYLTGACIIQATREELLAHAVGPDWARQLVGQRIGKGAPVHVCQVLHHRQARPAPQVIAVATPSSVHLPLVTIIIPTRNRVNLLRTCLTGIAATDYPQVEVIVVDNDSDDPETLDYLARLDPRRYCVLRHAGAFNYSAINNRAVAQAQGRLLCLLNNDIEVIEPHWLATMAVQAMRADVGAVGAQLLYPDGRIQHAGVVTGMGGAAGHAHRLLRPDEEGYFRRHSLPQFISAVTAACLLVDRERFLAVGGLDERRFSVAFNDVDLCLRLNQRGWQSLYEPRATLVHHESVSRGLDRDPVGAARLAGELAALKALWGTDADVDPYHHPQLSRASERFGVRL